MTDPASHPPLGLRRAVMATEAERWLARHDRGLSVEEAKAFALWRTASPDHAREFDQLAAAWHAADGVKANADLVAWSEQIDLDTRRAARQRRTRRARFAWTGVLAAAAAVVLTWTGPWRERPLEGGGPPIVQTASIEVRPSTARRLTLPDGSIAALRGDSEVQLVFTPTERRVRLVRGEAYFAVQRIPERPFVVEVDGMGVRAVGTAFNVRRDRGAADVLVTEGTVSLHGAEPATLAPEAPRVVANQRARVEGLVKGGPLGTVAVQLLSPAEVEQALSWQRTRLVLDRTTLADAVVAFNQHGGARLEVGDSTVAERRMSGTFRADNAEAFVRLLEQAAEVRVERRPDGVVLLYAVE